MNILPCEIRDGQASFAGNVVQTASPLPKQSSATIEVGVRPEFVRFDEAGFAVDIVKVDDLGRYKIVVARHDESTLKMIVDEDVRIPTESPRISFDPHYTRLYADGWVVE